MLMNPIALTNTRLGSGELKMDKKTCLRVGPCGLGKKALYLNSQFLDRYFYIPYDQVERVFKRVAMSKGGYSGKGAFGSLAYLVVVYGKGQEKVCRFKYEDDVDKLLARLEKDHPEIPRVSVEGERRLAEAKAKEEARYVKDLSPEAKETIKALEEAQEVLRLRPGLSVRLSAAARQKRVIDNINPTYQRAALVILALGIAGILFGVYALFMHWGAALYFVLFGFAAVFLMASTRILPTGKRNKKSAQAEWDEALAAMKDYLSSEKDFPLPAQYAHPFVLERMIRVIREGRCETLDKAYALMKDDLKALNADVTVSQNEYDEVVAVKPMFLICDYQ